MTASADRERLVQHEEKIQRPPAGESFHRWVLPDGTPWIQFFRRQGNYLLRFPSLADFEISGDGYTVQSWPAPGVPQAVSHHLYLNQVLPLALSRQGKLVLHASAVTFGGRSVAFVAQSGRGKSTLAAAFAAAGMEFMTDDGLQIEWREGQLVVLPGHASIRLWEDSQHALIGQRVEAAPALAYTTKLRFLASDTLPFCAEPQPLHAAFFLGDGQSKSITIAPMHPSTALLELVRHSFLLDVNERDLLALHFDVISRMANLPVHYYLDYPRHFNDLPLLLETIIRQVNEAKH